MSSQEVVVSFLPVLAETEMLFFCSWTSHPKHKHLCTVLWVCRQLAAVCVLERRQQVEFRKDYSSIHSQAACLLHRRVWWEYKEMENEVGFLKMQCNLGKTCICKANLIEFFLVVDEKIVLCVRKTSHHWRKILPLYTLFKCILLKLVFMFRM